MKRNNTRTALLYTVFLVAGPLAWIPFSSTPDFSKLWISGVILAIGSGWTLREIAAKNTDKKFLSMAVRKLRASAILTLLFAVILIVLSFF